MAKLKIALCASVCALSLGLSGCGGGGGSSGGPSSQAPTPTPTPTPTPSPTPTYQTLAELTGDQTFQTAGVFYTDDSTDMVFRIDSVGEEVFGNSTVIEFFEAADEVQLTGAGGTPTVRFNETTPTRTGAGFQTWEIANGSILDVVTLFEATREYSFVGSWIHLEAGVGTYRLSTAGIPTQDGDYPSGNVTYSIVLGGSANDGTSGEPVDATRSTGSLVMDFATGQGTFDIVLIGQSGASLGNVSGTINRDSTGPGFTGTVSYAGTDGVISGAFFGPQAVDVAFASALASSDGSIFYVGLAGGGT